MLFLTRQHNEDKNIEQNDGTDMEQNSGTACDKPLRSSMPLPLPSLSSSPLRSSMPLPLPLSSAVQPSQFPLFDTDAQSNIPIKSSDRALSSVRPPLFPLFDTDTDTDDDNGDSGGINVNVGSIHKSLDVKVTEQNTGTASGQNSGTICRQNSGTAVDRLYFQRALVRMRQVHLISSVFSLEMMILN